MDLSLRAVGKTIVWTQSFREAMEQLCAARDMAADLPARIATAPLKSQGLLLVWPLATTEAGGYTVTSSPQGRRVTTDLTESFRGLGADIPNGLMIEIPVISYRSPKHGPCLALQFQKATFLYKRSRGSAIGLMDDLDEDE